MNEKRRIRRLERKRQSDTTITSSGGGSSSGGVTDFLELNDTPNSYVGSANKINKVNSGETAIEFDTDLTIDNGNVYSKQGATNMSSGFFYIPSGAGIPSGTPTSYTGRVAMYYDSTNNDFYIYSGSWRKVNLT